MATSWATLFLPSAAAYSSTPAASPEYAWGVVFDCGSSGTRAHYFKWPKEDSVNGLEEVLAPNGSLKVEPGISQFGVGQGCEEGSDDAVGNVCTVIAVDDDHPSCAAGSHPCPTSIKGSCCLNIDEYISPLLGQAAEVVPEALQSTSKLRMRATAGMRLLNSSVESAIWGELGAAASKTAFDFDEVEGAYTLAGNYEGVYGWLAVQQTEKSRGDTFGWMDLGGASTQIAFKPEDGVVTENAVAVQLNGIEANVYSEANLYSISYMLSGQDQGQLRVAQYLYFQKPGVEVANPCFNPGYRQTMKVCEGVALASSSTCTEPTKEVLFVGTGKHNECSDVIADAIIHKDYQCLQKPCAVAGRYQPAVGDMKFLAGSAFYYTVDGLGLPTGSGNYTTTANIAEAGDDFCKLEWDSLDEDTQKYGNNYCFASAYIPAMLDAYGIDRNKEVVTYASDVNGEALEWPIGCQLYYNILDANPSECTGSNAVALQPRVTAARA